MLIGENPFLLSPANFQASTPLLAFLIDFSNSWAPRQFWKLLYAPMGDLLRFSKPAFDQIRMASLCIWIYHVIILLWKPMTSQGWLLYTYSIHISVMLQFQSPLCVNLQVWLAILWVQLFYHLGSISTEVDVKNFYIWKENSHKNWQNIENIPMGMFN